MRRRPGKRVALRRLLTLLGAWALSSSRGMCGGVTFADATSTTEPETEPEVDDGAPEEVDFAALAAEADADAYEGDAVSLRELGRWLSTESAREDTVDLLRDEGWVR